jgi:hypothetical protein
MNCSGKHAAMLACCVANGWPTEGYLEPDAPVQQALIAAVEQLAGEPVRHLAVDGCGAPQHALTLPGLARAFGRLTTAAPGTPEARVAAVMRAHPVLVGGRERDVPTSCRASTGCSPRTAAEGVYAVALPDGRPSRSRSTTVRRAPGCRAGRGAAGARGVGRGARPLRHRAGARRGARRRRGAARSCRPDWCALKDGRGPLRASALIRAT